MSDDYYKQIVESCVLCPECHTACTENPGILCRSVVLGDGKCILHGSFAYTNDSLKILCVECAKLSGKCQLCGKKFGKTVMILGEENL